MRFKKYFKFGLFSVLFFACNEKQDFTMMLRGEFSNYDIALIPDKSFLSCVNLSVIEIKYEDLEVISYYLIPRDEVDSFFMKEYLAYAYKQSCFSTVTEGVVFTNFVYDDTAFVIKPCSDCAALFSKPCNDFKKEFSRFLDEKKVSPFPLK